MFSKLAIQSGKFAPVLRSGVECRAIQQAFVRAASHAPAPVIEEPKGPVVMSHKEAIVAMNKQVSRWNEVHEFYNSPERDYVNFPMVEYRSQTVGFRMFFIPYPWFDAFYKYTGVTGPYVLVGGAFLVGISKEFFIITEHSAFFPAAVFGMYHLFHNTRMGKKCKHPNPPGLKHSMKPFLANLVEKLNAPLTNVNKVRAADVQHKKDFLASVDLMVKQEGAKKYLFDIYRENMDLQLEERYRKRLDEVHTAVKKRLDYQVAVDAAKRQFEQQHMVNYIVSSVRSSITGQQEKEMLAKCFSDLKSLAQKQAAA